MLLIVNFNQTGLPTGAGIRAGAVPANSSTSSDRMGRPRLYTCVVSTLSICTASPCPLHVSYSRQAGPNVARNPQHSRAEPYTICSFAPSSFCLTRSWSWRLHAHGLSDQSQR